MSSLSVEAYQSLIDFIKNHYGHTEFVPLHAPCFNELEKSYLNQCIDSTFVSSVGEFVNRFEEDLVRFTGAKHAVAVVNGTMGLYLALKVVGVQADHLVLTQSMTFVATVNAIKMHQADPLFLDVSRDTLGLDADGLKQFLVEETEIKNGQCIHKQSGRKITACVPMHTLGFPAEIQKIAELCSEYHIKLVEDAAESLGSSVQNRHTGTFGDVGVFSFNGNKVITTGGGGMLVTDNEQLAKHARHLSTTAKVPHKWLFEHDEIAYNLRMPNINAALGVAQMEKLTGFLAEKKQLATVYADTIRKFPCLQFFDETSSSIDISSNYWLNAVITENKTERDRLLQLANDQEVQMRPLWTPMHQLDIYCNELSMPLPSTEWLADRLVNIPSGVKCNG